MSNRRDVSEVVDLPARKKKSKAPKVLIIILVVLAVLVVGIIAAVFIYMNSLGINFINRENATQEGVSYQDKTANELSDEDASEYHGMITAMQDNSGLSECLKSWYTNGGDLMHSKNVLNILIVGIDATGNKSMEGNSDVMMVASLNVKKQTITLCSFLRDSYTYFESTNGNGYYAKLNGAYAYGGANCLINAIEQNYKLKIDYFVAVDFEAFEKVIDAVGGVNVTVKDFEAKAIEEYAEITGVPVGENVNLTGEQALMFCRMRKIYATGDVKRTENQRIVINALIKKARGLGISDLQNVISTLCSYVYTDCSTSNILSLGTKAVLGQWYNYQVYSMEAPPESARYGQNGKAWVWIVDYPYSAQYVQKTLYGETNIEIPDNYTTAIDIVKAQGGY